MQFEFFKSFLWTMSLQRDLYFETIKPLLNDGKIQKFSDIFRFVKITVVAHSIGKRTTRLKELITEVEGFYIRDLLMLAHLFRLTAKEILDLIEKQLGNINSTHDEVCFPGIAALVKDGRIHVLSDILSYIEISKLARLLGRNSSRLKELTENVESFQIKKLLEMAQYCGLSITQIFILVAVQIDRKSSHGKNKSDM